MEEEKKKKNKTPLLIFIIAFIFTLLGYVGGYYFGQAVLKRDGFKEEPKKEEKKKEKAKLTEDQVKEIYLRYHSKLIDDSISLYTTTLESNIYSKDSFKITELENVGYTIADRIYDDIKDQIKYKEKTYSKDGEYPGAKYYEITDIEKYVKEDFKKLFGNNLEYNIDLFNGCHVLSIAGNRSEKKRFDMEPQCGDGLTTTTFTYKMTGFEEKDDKLYITEKVTFKHAPDNSSTPTINEETYKWTYSKYEDTYVLLQVDKIKK